MRKFNEKRKHPRINVSIPLQYKELRGNSYLSKGTLTKNISESGIKFISDSFISLAHRLIVEINLPSNPKPVKAISRVVWIKKLDAGNNYEVGNQFLAMTREDEAIISDYAKKAV